MKEKTIDDKIIATIKNYKKIILIRHVNPDGDAYGFQFGLKKIIELNWPDKIVKILGQPNNNLSYIGNNFDKVSDEEFNNSLVIIGDTANIARIDEPRWRLGETIIKIDHHPNRESYGDIELVKDNYCATCEILAEFVQNNNLKINAEIARILYHGIVTDTMRFYLRFPQPRTFFLAGFLLQQNFDLQDLYQIMYQQSDLQLKFMAYIYQNYKTTKNGVSYLMIDYPTLKQYHMLENNVAYDYVSLLANVTHTKIWALFCQISEDNLFKAELRSHKLTINSVALNHGGGGHKTSAGASIKNFEEAREMVAELDKIAQENSQ